MLISKSLVILTGFFHMDVPGIFQYKIFRQNYQLLCQVLYLSFQSITAMQLLHAVHIPWIDWSETQVWPGNQLSQNSSLLTVCNRVPVGLLSMFYQYEIFRSKCWLAIQNLWYFCKNRNLMPQQFPNKRSPLPNLTISGNELEIVIMGNIFDIYTIGYLVDNH